MLECHLDCIACECYRPERCYLWIDPPDSRDEEIGCFEVEEWRKCEGRDGHCCVDF